MTIQRSCSNTSFEQRISELIKICMYKAIYTQKGHMQPLKNVADMSMLTLALLNLETQETMLSTI